MFTHEYPRLHKGVLRLIVISLLASFMVATGSFVSAPAARALASTTCGTPSAGFTGGGFQITPLHGKAFYLDLKKSMNATYVGYSVKNVSGSTKNDLWLELTDFRAGAGGTQVIGLANPADSLQPIGTLDNNATKVIYVLLKSNSYSTADQTHDVRVHSGYPNGSSSIAGSGAAECFYTFSKVSKTYSVVKTLAASANKVNSITVNTTSPVLGSTIVVTVKGQTGQGGSGSVTPDGDIMWLSAASSSAWPTRSLRLESTSIDIKYKKTGGSTDTFADRLLITSVNSGSTKFTSATTYTATFTFRILGGLSSNPVIKPVAQIASGTQIKHTGSYPSTQTTINLAGVTSSMNSSKNVVSIGSLETVTGVVYRAVNYKITETDTALQTTLDKIVDDPAAGVIFKAGSAKIRDSIRTNSLGTTIADPVDVVTGGNDHKYTFGGPFKGYLSGGSYVIELTYTMLIPTNATATYTNIGYGMVGNTIVGRSTSTVGAAGVVVTGTTSAAIDPAITSTSLPKQPQTIDFPALPSLGVGSTQVLDAVAESGLPVTYTSNTPSVCSVSDGVLTILAQGTCSITASQAGNDFWDPANNVTNTTSTLPGQAITFVPNETMTVGGSQVKAATSDSGLPVTLTVLTPDICTVTGSATPFTISGVSGASGACVIIASQAGGTINGITYGPAMDVERTINIGALQAISFGSLVDKTVGFNNYSISATSKTPTTSGSNTLLPVTFTSKSLDVCEVTTDTSVSTGGSAGVSSVTVEGVAGASGICVITASQDGLKADGTQSAYAPAVDVTQTFMVGTVPSIVVTTSVSTIGSGGTLSATATITVPSNGTLNGTVTLYVDGTRASTSAVSTTSVNVSLSTNGTSASNFSNIKAGILSPSDPDGEMVFTATFTKSSGDFFSTSTRTSVLVVVTPPELPVATTNDVLESAVGVDTATITGSYIPKGSDSANAVIYLGTTSNSQTDSTTAVASSGSTGSGSSSITINTLASGLTAATKYFYKTGVVRGGYQAEGQVKSFTTKPGAPVTNSVTAGSTSASVAFTAITPGAGVTIAYRAVCISSDGGATGTATGSSSPILVSSLTTGGKSYTCKVAATTTTNGSGGGGYGAESTATSSFTTLTPKTSRTIQIRASINGGVDSATSVNITYGETATLVVIDLNNEGTKSATKASGSACTISGLTVTSAGVGTCTFDGAVSEGTTYAEAATTSPASVVVGQKALTITASSHSVTEGDAVPSISGTYSAFAFSENASNLSGTLSCTTGYTTASAAGTYATTCTGKTSSNYAISFVDGVITVSAATVTTYTITYDLNGGSGTTPTETPKSNGQTFTTPSETGFSRSGYSLTGWSCNSVTTGMNTVVTVGTSNFTCVAIWSQNSAPAPSNNNNRNTSPAPVTPAVIKKIAIASLVTIATTPVKTTVSVVPAGTTSTPTPKPSASPAPSASSTPKPSASPAPSASSTPKPSASPAPGTSATPKPSPTPTPGASSSPSAVNDNLLPEGVTLSKTTVIPTANTKSVTFKGIGISKVAVVNEEVSVAAKPGFSGKTVVTITLKEDEEISVITADVLVIPLPVTNPVVKEINEEKTRISWVRSPNAIGYEVIQNGVVLCTTKSASCTLDSSISANPPVEIKALGKDETESVPREATYVAAPQRVVPDIALVVNFDTAKYALDTGDRILIQNFASEIKIFGFKEVDISGHTDSRGGIDNNVLSINRAKASRDYLLKLVPGLKVTINGYADVISVAPNSTVQGMAANRRAEFRVVK